MFHFQVDAKIPRQTEQKKILQKVGKEEEISP